MSLRKVLPLLGASVLALTSCGKQVSYAEFHEAALKAEKHPYSSAVVTAKGTYKDGSTETKFDGKASFVVAIGVWAPKLADGDDAAVATLFTVLLNVYASEVADGGENVKYYVGGGFEVKNEDGSVKYDKYGCLSSMKGTDWSVKVSYSK